MDDEPGNDGNGGNGGNAIVIIGGGLAAVRTVEELRRAEYTGPLAIVSDETDVESVVLTDGTEVAADMVVLGIGARPATDWLAGSGIDVDHGDGGIICDATGRTSAPDVWAAGDVAFWRGYADSPVRVEHWRSAVTQARLPASAMLERDPPPGVIVPYFWSDQYDVKIQCLGVPRATDAVHLAEDDGRRFLACYERGGVLAAVVGADMRGEVMRARAKIATRAPISDVLA